eukprot:s5098_g5.t1
MAFDGCQSLQQKGCTESSRSVDIVQLSLAGEPFTAQPQELGDGGTGYGVTLPFEAGGFPLLLHDHRFHVQASNLMELQSPEDLECPKLVDVIMADAQDLGRRSPANQREKKRRNGKSKNAKQGAGDDCEAAGIGAACATLGIWALTFQDPPTLQMHLALCTFFFRFGWRGRGDQEEHWYREAILRLLGLVIAFFQEVFPFKSESFHQAGSRLASASQFLATLKADPCFEDAMLETRLKSAIQSIIACEAVGDLPECIQTLAEFSTPANHQRIDELLDTVSRVRAIGLSSRTTVEAGGRESPEAQLIIRPVPYHLTMPRLRQHMECYGKIAYIRRRSHAVGVGADALIQFVQPAHAKMALEAVNDMKVLGETVVARLGNGSLQAWPINREMPPKAGEISQSVEESNKLRESLGIQKLKEDKPQSSKGSSNDPVFAPADKKAEDAKDKDKESKRKAAAAKSKRDHEDGSHFLRRSPRVVSGRSHRRSWCKAPDWEISLKRRRGRAAHQTGSPGQEARMEA